MDTLAPFGYEIANLTVEWLTNLGRNKEWITEEQSVVSFEVTKLDDIGYKSVVYAVKCEFSHPVNESVPRSLIFKISKLMNGRANQMILNFLLQECRFYEYIQDKEIPLRTPKLYYSSYQDDGKFILIVEDLRFGSGKSGDQVQGIDIQHAKNVLTQIARFHAAWWESPLLEQIQWISNHQSPVSSYSPLFVSSWNEFAADYRAKEYNSTVSEKFLQLGEYLSQELKGFNDKKYSRSKKTLLHGDLRGDNIFVWDEGEIESVCALDFQCVHAGNAAEDVAYFLGGSLRQSDFVDHEEELLKIYYDELIRSGVNNFSYEEFYDDYKQYLLLNVVCPALSLQRRKMGIKAAAVNNQLVVAPPRVDALLRTWLDRTIASSELKVPNGVEYLQSRWSHVQRD